MHFLSLKLPFKLTWRWLNWHLRCYELISQRQLQALYDRIHNQFLPANSKPFSHYARNSGESNRLRVATQDLILPILCGCYWKRLLLLEKALGGCLPVIPHNAGLCVCVIVHSVLVWTLCVYICKVCVCRRLVFPAGDGHDWLKLGCVTLPKDTPARDFKPSIFPINTLPFYLRSGEAGPAPQLNTCPWNGRDLSQTIPRWNMKSPAAAAAAAEKRGCHL